MNFGLFAVSMVLHSGALLKCLEPLNNIFGKNKMRMYQVYFKMAESRIIFANTRQEIWKKYRDVQCMYRIDVV